MSGIDTAMPDVRKRWSYHAAWNQNDRFWQQDFQQIADCGFDLLRWQMPWSLVQPKQGEFRWGLIDEKVELATKLGMEIFYPIVHFNLPKWLARKSERHAVLSEQLNDRVAEYTDKLLSRYRFRLVIPWVEVQMDAFQRGMIGNWQPHMKGRRTYNIVYKRLIGAFRASAKVAREHGATVFCSEPAPEIQTVLDLRDSIDIAGIDLYPHVHRQFSVLGYFRHWSKKSGLPLCISEFGTPESYNPLSRKDTVGQYITAGIDEQRAIQAADLRDALMEAQREGIRIPYGGWYPGTGNIGWGDALTKDRSKFDCDRAGLVDLERQADGTLKRVLCRSLVEQVIGLRDLYRPQPAVATLAASAAPVEMIPSVPEMLPQVAGTMSTAHIA